MGSRNPLTTLTRAWCLMLAFGSWVVPGIGTAAEAPFQFIGDGMATDISSDGAAVVGRDEDTGASWHWSADSGRSVLGPGTTAESPAVSSDGTKVAASLPADEGDGEAVFGIWSAAGGWAPCGSVKGQILGMSGDGATLVGFVRDSGGTRAAAWNRGDGLFSLGVDGVASRANDTNRDGSVIVGWAEDPSTGMRQPTVWDDREPMILATTPAFCEATAVSPDGRIIVGQVFDPDLNRRVAALWLRSDYGWVQEELGVLPGTFPGYGQALALDLSADGRVIVGRNSFDRSRSAGFVWTPEGGLAEAGDHLARLGIMVPEDFTIEAVTAVSDEGTVMTGYGRHSGDWPFRVRSFLVRTPGSPALADERPGGDDRPPTLPAQADPGPLKKYDSIDQDEPWRD